MARIVERNIHTLLERRETEERNQGRQERLAASITRFAGSMTFVYLHVAFVSTWIMVNAGLLSVEPFDPSFVILASVASVEAIFLSTFVLITQNRMSAMAAKRADLDLQISLLSEHEVTRLVSLVSAIAERLDLPAARDPELDELKQDVAPEKVLETIEKSEAGFGGG